MVTANEQYATSVRDDPKQKTTDSSTPQHFDSEAYENNNRSHFDGLAERYECGQITQVLASRIGSAFLKEYDFDEEKTVVMDFACGTGLVSRLLAPHAKQIIGFDISQNMVDQYNLRVSNQGISSEEMHAICITSSDVDADLKRYTTGKLFDVIVCSLAFHHIKDIDKITQILSSYICPGGTLLVADIIKRTEKEPTNDTISRGGNKSTALLSAERSNNLIVAHKGGFEENVIRSVFEQAGLTQFSFNPRVRLAKKNKVMTVFVAKGTKLS